jgi:hypothetical protein
MLIEAKSGSQTYEAAVHQLKCYRAALLAQVAGPLLVWGIAEAGAVQTWDGNTFVPFEDLWLFTPASAIPSTIAALGLAGDQHAQAVVQADA